MSGTTPALLIAAAGVAAGHAILPDHWAPLAVLGRTRTYSLGRVARLSTLAGIAHVLVSLLLGAVIIAIGLQFRSTIESAQETIVGAVLILTGLAFATLELTGRGHGHGHYHEHRHGHDEGHSHGHDTGRARSIAAVMVPFGAAASPDLTILPVFLAATAAGIFAAVGALIVFSIVTIGTIVGLTLSACFGGYQIHGRWLERWGNMFTGAVLVIVGALVFASIV